MKNRLLMLKTTVRTMIPPQLTAPLKGLSLHALPLTELAIGLPILWLLIAKG